MTDKAKGWFSIYRSIEDHWIWKEKPFSKGHAWIDLILMANHEDNKLHFNGCLIIIKKGQLLTSKLRLSKKWGWNHKTVTAFLTLLKTDNMADNKTDNRSTLITITNYNEYQVLRKNKTDNKTDNRADSHGIATGQPRDTNNNVNNVNNDNNNYICAFEEIWKKYPKPIGKKQALRHFQSSVKSQKDIEDMLAALINYLKSDTVIKGFIQNGATWFNNWRDWIEVKKFDIATFTPQRKKMTVDEFEEQKGMRYSPGTVIDGIEIVAGCKGDV